MAPLGEIISSLYGALRLARGDVNGLSFFNTSVEGFWRSFTAAVLIAPLFIILLAVRFALTDGDFGLLRFASVEAIAYIIGWTFFPLLMFHLTEMLGLPEKFIRYIVAYNWASVIQNVVYLPFALLVEGHLLQGNGVTFIGLILLALVMLYTWFVTRTALEISAVLAAGIVLLDLFISIFINSISQGMLRVS